MLGDLGAVAQAFKVPSLASLSTKAKFRDPDSLHNPVEELRRLVPGYQKIDGARRCGPLLDLEKNQSRSFQVFCKGLLRHTRGTHA